MSEWVSVCVSEWTREGVPVYLHLHLRMIRQLMHRTQNYTEQSDLMRAYKCSHRKFSLCCCFVIICSAYICICICIYNDLTIKFDISIICFNHIFFRHGETKNEVCAFSKTKTFGRKWIDCGQLTLKRSPVQIRSHFKHGKAQWLIP